MWAWLIIFNLQGGAIETHIVEAGICPTLAQQINEQAKGRDAYHGLRAICVET